MRHPDSLLPSGRLALVLVLILVLSPSFSSAFYLPGVAPTSYGKDELVPLHANRLTPVQMDSELARSAVSYDYYATPFRFCEPQGGAQDVGSQSLGAVIFGDRIKTSPFELHMLKNESCKRLCDESTFSPANARFVNEKIEFGYVVNWLIDGLPAGQPYMRQDGSRFYSRGFPLGESLDDEAAPTLHNHYDITVDYHAVAPGSYRVVGVVVEPSSRAESRNIDGGRADCGSEGRPLVLSEDENTVVTWTYSVSWRPSRVAWAVRWDTYLYVDRPEIHWFWLIISSVIVVLMSATVATILSRALKRDFARYSRLDAFSLDDFSNNDLSEDGIQEDSGWKLVHGDVFRPPLSPLLLSVFLGNGAQLFLMTGTTILFALLGFLSPSNRGSLGTTALLLYTIFSFFGGYVSARMYTTFGGEEWKKDVMLTPVLVPAVVFGTFFLLNLFLWGRGSSGAVPFSTMLALVGIWFLISVPLSFTGSWMGFKQPPFEAPVHTNQIPRQIPPSGAHLRPVSSMLLVGSGPFVAVLVELHFIMNSIWFNRIYYMFGFLFLCYALMVVLCAAVTVWFVYHLLCAENYRWQWRAFNSAGAGAIFVFLYAIVYWILYLRFAGFTSVVLFVGYSALISFLFFILTGTIGFFSSWAFVHRIYRSIRVD